MTLLKSIFIPCPFPPRLHSTASIYNPFFKIGLARPDGRSYSSVLPGRHACPQCHGTCAALYFVLKVVLHFLFASIHNTYFSFHISCYVTCVIFNSTELLDNKLMLHPAPWIPILTTIVKAMDCSARFLVQDGVLLHTNNKWHQLKAHQALWSIQIHTYATLPRLHFTAVCSFCLLTSNCA